MVSQLEIKESEGGVLLVFLGGQWRAGKNVHSIGEIERSIVERRDVRRLCFRVNGLEFWDASLIAFLVKCEDLCRRNGVVFDIDDLPKGVKRLLFFSSKRVGGEVIEAPVEMSFLGELGKGVVDFFVGCGDVLAFLGELVLSLGRVIFGKGHARWRDFVVLVQDVGAEALPIVTLISFLVGFIMAFIGFTQLKRFGATIFVADLVGIAMVREMGVMMTGVIMCGRTGAAFAATLGSMKIGEEIDALRTTGISPFDFLVTPRVLALLFMMPILVIYADFIGVFGGLVVTSSFSEITFAEYWQETQVALTMKHILIGVYKSIAFGVLIALTGCLRGMQCGSSSSAVGDAATSAVVTGITSLVVADAIFAVLFDALDM